MQVKVTMVHYCTSPSEDVNIVEYHPYEHARLGDMAMRSCYIHIHT